jgi:5-methylthioadenosine/S-adenosylhomocysteine deaminase
MRTAKSLGVKSRTWSRKDAEHKALVARELIRDLGVANPTPLTQDYIEIVGSQFSKS